MYKRQEYDEGNPFLFFADHIDPEIARATREGRRREFERFTAFADGDVPDPGAMETFVRSHVHPDAGDPEHREYYRELLALRGTLRPGPVETSVDEQHRFLRVRRGDVELLMNFSDHEHDGVPPWSGAVR